MKTRTEEELAIIGALIFVLGVVVLIYFTDITLFDLGDNLPEYTFNAIPTDLTEFQKFAIAVNFGYELIPTIGQQFSISAITTQLLQSGFSPYIFMIIIVGGMLTGQMILYSVGIFSKKIHKGSIGNLAGHNHFLHKYNFLVYVIVPFVGILGDAVMVFTGHQRINPLKIIPFLLIGDIVVTAKWILPTMAQLELGKFLGG